MADFCYYYLHNDGSLIHKKFLPDPSDFVVRGWEIDLEKRSDAYRMLIEAAALGANMARINSLAHQWECDGKDGLVFAELVGLNCKEKDGSYEVCVEDDPETRPHGFGSSPLSAMIDYVSLGNFKHTPHGGIARSI